MKTHHHLNGWILILILLSLVLLLIPINTNAYASVIITTTHQGCNQPRVVIRRPAEVYYGPSYYHPNAYWTGWTPYYKHGYTCQKRCLISQENAGLLRCVTRCY